MIRHLLRQRVRQTRAVTVTATRGVTVNDAVGQYFRARIDPPSESGESAETSPRDAQRYRLVYGHSRLDAAPGLAGADRVELKAERIYELVTDPRPLRSDTQVVGYEAEVVPLPVLYPQTANLRDMGSSTDVVAAMPAAIWPAGDERVAEHGDYSEYEGEAPIEHAAALAVQNRELILAGARYKILSAVRHLSAPHVKLSLRLA